MIAGYNATCMVLARKSLVIILLTIAFLERMLLTRENNYIYIYIYVFDPLLVSKLYDSALQCNEYTVSKEVSSRRSIVNKHHSC